MSRASDKAYARIRELIVSGELAPGEQLAEEALAQACGVSRTPVREALRRLEAEQLVTRTDTQRSFVAEWSTDEIADAFELRALLEGRAARRAAERMDEAIRGRIASANNIIKQAIECHSPNISGFLEGNRNFHAEILAAAGSRRLTSLLGALVEQPVVQRTAHHYSREALLRAYREHEELLAAFERRDGAWAESIMTAHIFRAYHAYLDACRTTAGAADIQEAAE
jgi:DNA-binding GntR family transcriptional regulator